MVQVSFMEQALWSARCGLPLAASDRRLGHPSRTDSGNLGGNKMMAYGLRFRVGLSLALGLIWTSAAVGGDPLFAPPVQIITGSTPMALAIGDLNDDQVPDLAVANAGDNNVVVLLGVGDGTFDPWGSPYTVGAHPRSVAIGDLNGDQVPDIVVANENSANVSVLLGVGDGTFFPALEPHPTVGTGPLCVAIGDLNGDQVLDLAVANWGSDDVSVLRGVGDGTFVPWLPPIPVGDGPNCVAIGDLNGDQVPDLAVANYHDDNVSVLRGVGDGTFVPFLLSPITVGDSPNFVAIGDLNGDQVPDLAVTNGLSDNVSVLLGVGNGTFHPAVPYAVGVRPTCVAIDDLDGDQTFDLAVTNLASDTVSVLLGVGDGTFHPAVHYSVVVGADPKFLAISDLNNDLAPDLAVGHHFGNSISILLHQLPGLFDCNGNGIPDACDIDCGPAGGACDLPGCGQSADCNTNGVPDECDIASGTSLDLNGNGIPDECEPARLILETSESCFGDFVEIQLWMRELPLNVTGFQAFLEYDEAVMTYRGDLSGYTPQPFPLHIQSITTAQVGAGQLNLDGSVEIIFPPDPGTSEDSLLATLVFEVVAECDISSVGFRDMTPLMSRVTSPTWAIPTTLTDSPTFTLDSAAPTVTGCPEDILVSADVGGCDADVPWTPPIVEDPCGLAPIVEYHIDLGDDGTIDDVIIVPEYTFPAGCNRVHVRATDLCGNVNQSCDFAVCVDPVNDVYVEVVLVGVSVPVERCIHFVLDDCGNSTDVLLSFIDHDGDPATWVRAMAVIQVECGMWDSLCAKDEQHTLFDTTALTIDGSQYVATTLLSLRGGDTNNDSIVEIEDVAWFLSQFGEPAASGGCPWDGTRDADFSNNGAVGIEDYGFLSENWLLYTECGCSSPLPGGGGGIAPTNTEIPVSSLPVDVGSKVDLNRDGVVDHKDVAAFERRHRLGNGLSSRIKKTAAARANQALGRQRK